MTDAPKLKIYNTLTRKKEDFVPNDASNVRMYVCGPTVYDFAHIGNARPVIVFDVLNRLLRHLYGEDHVTYVRNITDVDDKINARALRDYADLPLNEAIRKVTEKTTKQFHKDVEALGCLEPDFEPRATEHIDGMVKMIEVLIDKGNAYQAGGEVLFDVSSMADYGQLSNRKIEDQQAGARIATTSHKKNPGDFVLWKLSSENEPGWSSPWGTGRPGWHLECSVMSEHHLGKIFDIHGGGLDLIFPHHENEIAQSRCAHDNDKMANYWMHNGYLQVEGKKMSKSDGNFVTITDLLETKFFANQMWHGRVLRLAMLMTHYRQPIDWTADRLVTARSTLYDWNMRVFEAPLGSVPEQIVSKLSDDLNTVGVISELHNLFSKIPLAGSGADIVKASGEFRAALELLGLYEFGPSVELLKLTVVDGSEQEIGKKIDERLAHIANKGWAAADAIRDELLAQGIQLKDGKDPETGERTTTWEVKR